MNHVQVFDTVTVVLKVVAPLIRSLTCNFAIKCIFNSTNKSDGVTCIVSVSKANTYSGIVIIRGHHPPVLHLNLFWHGPPGTPPGLGWRLAAILRALRGGTWGLALGLGSGILNP